MNAVCRSELTIDQFEAGEIDAERFDHEAHVYVGWLYVQRYDLADAIRRFDAALQRLVQKLGATGKYHATLTWFFLLLIAERAEHGQSWQSFQRQNQDLTQSSKNILSRYYSDNRLFSTRARERFMLPDKLAV